MENEQGTQESEGNEEVTPEPINQETPEEKSKALGGSNFYKQKLAESRVERQKLADALEEEKTNKLQEKEKYKELWEMEKGKRVDAEEKTKTISKVLFDDKKTTAIKQEAMKLGILDSALDDLDIIDHSIVEVETTDRGTINIHGAKEFAEQLKSNRPHWFRKVGAPNINNANPEQAKVKELTAADIIKLQKDDPEKYKAVMTKKLSIA